MDRPRWKRYLIAAVKMTVAALVLWAVGRQVLRTWNDLKRHEVVLAVEPIRLTASGLLYLGGLSCCGRYYEQVLKASATPIAFAPALRAYLVSHLGKYVPGKAMVVVMRAGLSTPFGAGGATAALATFYETLVMMASGGIVASVGFLLAGASRPVQLAVPGWGRIEMSLYQLGGLVGLGLGLAFLVVVAPPVFRRLSLMMSTPFPRVGPDALLQVSAGLLARGLLWSTGAWVLLGMSQLEVASSLIPLTAHQYLAFFPVVAASVALATVGGFVVAVLPGGLGVREGILMVALAPAVGEDLAVVAALALRLVWVAAELLATAVLLPLGFRYRRVSGDPDESGPDPP
jgi:hypothetical protein